MSSTHLILCNKKMCCSIKTGQTLSFTATGNLFLSVYMISIKIRGCLGMHGAKHSPLNVFKMRPSPQRDSHSLPWSCDSSVEVFAETLVTATIFLFFEPFYLPIQSCHLHPPICIFLFLFTTTDNHFWVDIWSTLKIRGYLGMYGARHSPLNVFKMRQSPQRDRHSLP
jgi:hypothetical protein